MARIESDLDDELAAAVEIADPAERDAYVRRVCGDNPARLAALRGMINDFDAAASWIEQPAVTAVFDGPSATGGDDSGSTIGPYRLLEKLGEGGMGVVYVAEQTEPVRRRVALKIIKPGMDTREVIARFEAERQALAMMDHPNIAKILDGGATTEPAAQAREDRATLARAAAGSLERPFFVMELVRGLPITDYCDQSRLPTERRLRLFTQVCRAVQHAHQKGVIHRDIKPSNVLVTLHDGEPVPKVIDFGVAKAINQRLTDSSVYTRFTQMIGTPAYMSPEQAELSALDVDTRSDVYSLGVLLYELLTGTTPFDPRKLCDAGFDEMRRMIREVEPPRPSARISTFDAAARSTASLRRGLDERQLSRVLHGDLDWIVMKALEKDRNRRYESAGAFAADIERHLANEPIEARPPSVGYRVRKFARRNKAVVTSTALVSAAVVLGLGFSLWKYQDERAARRDADHHAEFAQRQTGEANRAKEEAERRRNDVVRNLYFADTRLGLSDWLVGNLGRLSRTLKSQIPKAHDPDHRGCEWYYLLSLVHRDEQTLFSRDAAFSSVAFSPDGRFLAAAEASGFTRIWDAGTWRVVQSLDFASQALSWSPDGLRLAGGRSDDGDVHIWNVATGETRNLRGHGEFVWATKWSEGGKRLISACRDGEVRVWDPDTGKSLHSWQHPTNGTTRHSFSPDGTQVANATRTLRIQIRDVATGQLLHEQQHEVWPKSLAWSPDGKHLVVGDGAGRCHIYQTGDWSKAASWHAHSGDINALRWSPDGQSLATVGDDNLVRLWDPLPGKEQFTLRGQLSSVWLVEWDPSGRRLVSTDSDHLAKIWSVPPVSEPRALSGNSDYLLKLAWGDSPHELLGLDPADASVTTWNVENGNRLRHRTVAKGQNGVLSHKGRWSAVSQSWPDADSRGRSWRHEIRDSESNASFTFDSPFGPHANGFSPDGTLLALSDWGGMTILDLRTRQVCFDLKCEAIRGFAWSPDGRLLAAGGRGEVGVYIVSLPERKLVQQIPMGPNGSAVYSVAWSPDGKRLATGDGNGLVEVFEMPAGRKLASTNIHTAHVYTLVWSADGRRVISGSEDQTVRMWEPDTCSELLRFDTPGVEINQILWSADGRRIVGAGDRGEIRIWDASPGYRYMASKDFLRDEFRDVQDDAQDRWTLGRRDEAIGLLANALDRQSTVFGPNDTETVALTADLAAFHYLVGQFDKAERLLAPLVEARRKSDGVRSRQLTRKLAMLGRCRLKLGKPAEAETALRECLAIRAAVLPENWMYFSAQSLLGDALLGQKKFAEAEPLLLQGYEGMKQREAAIPPNGKLNLPEAINRIVRFYEQTNRPEQAQIWREKLLTTPK